MVSQKKNLHLHILISPDHGPYLTGPVFLTEQSPKNEQLTLNGQNIQKTPDLTLQQPVILTIRKPHQ